MMRAVKQSLARRMVFLILAGAGLVLILVILFNYTAQRKRILETAIRQGNTLTESVVFQIEAQMGRAESIVQQSALMLSTEPFTRNTSARFVKNTLAQNPQLIGMAVALSEPMVAQTNFQILYGWRDNASIQVQDRTSPALDYQADWFYLPYYLQKPVWVDPYYDTDAKMLMVTYATPIVREGKTIAVITCDLSLEWIREMLDALPLGPGGIAILLSHTGTYVSHPERNLEMSETVFSLAESQKDPEVGRVLHDLGLDMISGKPGHLLYERPFDHQWATIHYRSIPSTGWVLGLIRPREQDLAPLNQLNQISLSIGSVGVLLLIIPALWIAWSITKPLRQLSVSAKALAGGNFDTPLPMVRSRDEVAELTEAFEHMRQDLRQYIVDLTTATAAKEKIASELSIAREIQLGIVPKLFPPFPNRPDIDLHALLIQAREVGGDLYDFGLIDDDNLYVAIGDVSGKGVPASLMMAVGKTLLKSVFYALKDPAKALAQVNNELAEDNTSCMFITLFCGLLNLKTGNLTFASAGHNPPILARTSGTLEYLKAPPRPALGAFRGATYQNHHVQLNIGDLLVLYTDGVTEAMNPENQLFGDEGLCACIQASGPQSARTFTETLYQAIQAHAGSAEQSDDITTLAIRFRGSHTTPSDAATLVIVNKRDELPKVATWIAENAHTELTSDDLMNVQLALEEWIVNVISYAYSDALPHSISLRLWSDAQALNIQIEDDGKAFDPTKHALVDTAQPLKERSIGGLGIHFIRRTMDAFLYENINNHNTVTLKKHITPPTPD
jgi:sigma-B regulation protein RsbU (phosphoserine phosphatase)